MMEKVLLEVIQTEPVVGEFNQWIIEIFKVSIFFTFLIFWLIFRNRKHAPMTVTAVRLLLFLFLIQVNTGRISIIICSYKISSDLCRLNVVSRFDLLTRP